MDVKQYNITKAAAESANPSGLWAGAPALAATGVNMKNTSGYTVYVDVSGGTVTAVKINKIATGLTSGLFRLAPGDLISITYSVAPTLVWNLDGIVSAKSTGVWADAPALAASTVAMKNTSGRPVTVCVSDGTVTVIKIDEVTTGLTSGAFHLRRDGVLKITYSVAPTLAWIYE